MTTTAKQLDVDAAMQLALDEQTAIGDHQLAAVTSGARRRVLWYMLNRDGGVTFKALSARFGLSEARVIVEMRRAVDEIETQRDRAQLKQLRELRRQLLV